MGTKYTTETITGYNSTPPADDGSVSESNKIKWSTIKEKLPDPVKTAVENINSKLVTALNTGPAAVVTSTTLDVTHNGKFVQASGSGVTLTLTDANTLAAGWYADIVNTDASNSIALARATASNTINATSADVTMLPLQALRVFVNAAANGFLTYADSIRERRFVDANTYIVGSADATKKVKFEVDGLTTATTRTVTVPNADGTMAYTSGRKFIQRVEATPYTAYTTITGTIPFDDTIPQNTEGTEIITVTITPTSATNRLIIRASTNVILNNTASAMALFQDSTNNALVATATANDDSVGAPDSYNAPLYIVHEMAAGTISATTFKIRIGSNGGNIYINGNGTFRLFGGVSAIRLSVEEVAP